MKEGDRTAYLFLPGGLGTMVGFCPPVGTHAPLLLRRPWLLWQRCKLSASDSSSPPVCCSQDELFEILTLVQLKKLGSKFPVPVVLVDYDGFYAGLLQVDAAAGV